MPALTVVALIVDTPEIAPALVIPVLFKLRPPAVIVSPPVVTVKPLLAVSNPFEVIVPVPVVTISPEVEIFPAALMVGLEFPPDWTSKAI